MSIQKPKTNRLRQTLVICFLLGGALVAVAQPQPEAALNAAQTRTLPTVPRMESSDKLSRKQKQDLLKYKFDKMKEDVDELAELALSLQKEVENTTENMLSLEVVEKAARIEKLAKKIKNNAKGY